MFSITMAPVWHQFQISKVSGVTDGKKVLDKQNSYLSFTPTQFLHMYKVRTVSGNVYMC